MVSEAFGDDVLAAIFLGARFLVAYIAIMWLALVFWTARDIRQRTRDLWVQTAATLLTLAFFVPGYWLYLVIRPNSTLKQRAEDHYREVLLAEYASESNCPACNRSTRSDFVVCPYCEYALGKRCDACSEALMPSWSACPHCGKRTRATATGEDLTESGKARATGSQPVHA